MSPKLERKRPDSQSHLVRRPEPIRTGDTAADDQPVASPARQAPAPPPATVPVPAARQPSATSTGEARHSEPASPPSPSPSPSPAPAETPPPRPTARDLAVPARQAIRREALKADVPADLALLQRLRRYRIDQGIDIRDQVAIAVDEWLTGQGY